MNRKPSDPSADSTTTLPAPIPVLNPLAVFTLATARAAIPGLNQTTLRREIREGRLRYSKRGGKYYLLGEWLIEWLRGGEVRRRPKTAPAVNDDHATN